MNELHKVAYDGSIERTSLVLSTGVVDIDEGALDGSTPLMLATTFGHSGTVLVLLEKGANISVVADGGFTALHLSAQQGYLEVTQLLVKAGAHLEAKLSAAGSTPLHVAAEEGHPEVVRVLIEAGTKPNSGRLDGSTPLYLAAWRGCVDAVKVLVRARANPLLISTSSSGEKFVPLDAAVLKGHLEIARKLIQEHGIEGCGGASGGVIALEEAAKNQHVEIMDLLTSAGVVDTGIALLAAAACGHESSVKFLLQQQKRKASGQGAANPDTPDKCGLTPLFCSVYARRPCSRRITRLLVDAGADTTTAVRITDARVWFFSTTRPWRSRTRGVSEERRPLRASSTAWRVPGGC